MTIRMNWQNLLSTQRFRTKNGEIVPTVTPSTQEGADALRTDFHIDYDRVVFSGAFRRLGRKTQVHPLAQHDLTHNRLTHSVEVASVGRSLGNRVGVMLHNGGFLPQGNTPSDIWVPWCRFPVWRMIWAIRRLAIPAKMLCAIGSDGLNIKFI